MQTNPVRAFAGCRQTS